MIDKLIQSAKNISAQCDRVSQLNFIELSRVFIAFDYLRVGMTSEASKRGIGKIKADVNGETKDLFDMFKEFDEVTVEAVQNGDQMILMDLVEYGTDTLPSVKTIVDDMSQLLEQFKKHPVKSKSKNPNGKTKARTTEVAAGA